MDKVLAFFPLLHLLSYLLSSFASLTFRFFLFAAFFLYAWGSYLQSVLFYCLLSSLSFSFLPFFFAAFIASWIKYLRSLFCFLFVLLSCLFLCGLHCLGVDKVPAFFPFFAFLFAAFTA